MEIWKEIVGYEYEVSNLGRVRSLDRERTCRNNGKRIAKGRILTGKVERNGYRSVVLSKNGFEKRFYIHRLVASAFIPENGGEEVNHINCVRDDNRLENLERCTRSENRLHSIKLGSFKPLLNLGKYARCSVHL